MFLDAGWDASPPMWRHVRWQDVARRHPYWYGHRCGPWAIPAGRMLAPAELSVAVRCLSNDDARFVLGTTLVLDGEFTAT
jgi:NAD(P)-dependent dehydrogenase (short-subunit alcohol dehydrogenase family)